MKNKEIVSAMVGSAFFAIPYLGLSVALAPALVIGGMAFGASELILSDVKNKETLRNTDKPLYLKINEAKKESKMITKTSKTHSTCGVALFTNLSIILLFSTYKK